MRCLPTILTITACAALATLAGCRTPQNDRANLGRPGSAHSVSIGLFDQAGQRKEAANRPDSPSLSGLSRAGWAPKTVVVPMDGVYAYRRYARNYRITDDTGRQRGDYPTPMSALDLSGGPGHDHLLETAVSGPYALYESLAMVPRFFFVQPWEQVRATPQEYWRAPVSTPRFTRSERQPAAGAEADPAAAPDAP